MGLPFVYPCMGLEDDTIEQFLSKIASANISPAGGSVVAVTGAMGASLCEMTCIHTLNNNTVGESEAEITTARARLRAQRETLLQLAEQDAQVIETVFKGSNTNASQAEVKRSLGVPLSIAETCLDVLEYGAKIVEWNDRAVVADAKTGIILANASLEAAILIVNSNLDNVSDQSFVDHMEGRVGEIVEAADELTEELSGSL